MIKIGTNQAYNNVEKVQEFFNWLTDKETTLEKINTKGLGLSKTNAFSIIYMLQEHLNIISDEIEKCEVCHTIGTTNDGSIEYVGEEWKESGLLRKPKDKEIGNYCEDCARNRFGFR